MGFSMRKEKPLPLFTEEELAQLRVNGQAANHGRDWPPVVRLVLPASNCVWLLTEILPGHNERFAFGLADYGTGSIHEGHIDLAALRVMADPLYSDRYKVQRDPDFVPKHPVSVHWIAAMMFGHLTDDPARLDDALQFIREGQERVITQTVYGTPSGPALTPA